MAFLLAPKAPSQDTTGPRLGETGVTSSAFGADIPINSGTVRVGTNLIWAQDLIEVVNVQETSIGKGGGITSTSTTFSYFLNAAYAIGEGPVVAWLRIWANNKLIYDASSTSGLFFKYPTAKIRFYDGDEVQLADPLIEAVEGVGNVPPNRGLAYFVVELLPVEDFGNAPPSLSVEVAYAGSGQFPFTDLFTPATAGPKLDQSMGWDSKTRTMWITDLQVAGGKMEKIDLDDLSVVEKAFDATSDVPGANSWTVEAGPALVEVNATATLTDPGKVKDTMVMMLKGNGPDFARHFVAFDKDSMAFLRMDAGGLWGTGGWKFAIPHSFFGFNMLLVVDSLNRLNVVHTFFDSVSSPRISLSTSLPGSPAVGGLVGPDSNGFFWAFGRTGSGPNFQSKLFKFDLVRDAVNTFAFRFVATFDVTTAVWGDPTFGGIARGMFLDEASQTLICASLGQLNPGPRTASAVFKFDIGTETVTGVFKDEDIPTTQRLGTNFVGTANEQGFANLRGEVTDTIVVLGDGAPSGNEATKIRISDMSFVTEYSGSSWGSFDMKADAAFVYVPDTDSIVANSGNTPDVRQFFLDRQTPGTDQLDALIARLAGRVGLSASDVDVSELTGIPVDGFELVSRGDVRGAIDRLSKAFFFDVVESDNKVKFLKRGKLPSVTIQDEDLGVELETFSSKERKLDEVRKQEVELPAQIDVKYIDQNRDYQTGSTFARRMKSPNPTVAATSSVSVDLPIVIDQQKAEEIADVSLAEQWARRDSQKAKLPPAFLAVDPADVVSIVRPGCPTIVSKMESTVVGLELLLEADLVSDDANVYSTSVLGAQAPGFKPSFVKFIGPSTLFVMNVPLLKDVHGTNRVSTGPYMGAKQTTTNWLGAVVQQSSDQIAYTQALTFSTSLVAGNAVTAGAANPSPFRWDRTTTITVSVAPSSQIAKLVSVTELQALNGANAALWGTDAGGWEVVNFVNAVDNGDGTVTLDTLIRGRRGTERLARAGHAAGEQFLFLNPGGVESAVQRILYSVGSLDLTKFFRTFSVSGALNDTTFDQANLLGVDLTPYEPVHIAATRGGGSGNDIIMSWIRQTRVGGENNWSDGITEVPVSEDSEAYEIDIFEAGGPLLRTVTGLTSPTHTYTDAEQTTDGRAVNGDPIDVNIYQISVQRGRGFPGNALSL